MGPYDLCILLFVFSFAIFTGSQIDFRAESDSSLLDTNCSNSALPIWDQVKKAKLEHFLPTGRKQNAESETN